jgi:hypothetical protein
VLKEEDFITPQFVVTLESHELKEVLIAAKKELSPILGESQKYVDLMYFGDQKSAQKNTTMPRDGSIEYGTDFVRIYKDVLKILRKNNPEK